METFDAQTIGVIAALQVAVQALLKTHPQPQLALSALSKERDPVSAILLGRPTPDAVIQAFDAAMAVFESRLARTT